MENPLYDSHEHKHHGEDALLIRDVSLPENSFLAGVFDGVSEVEEGGRVVSGEGKPASSLTADFLAIGDIANISDVVKLLKQANAHLYETKGGFARATATVALKIDDQLYVVNVGDSPAYLIRNGRIEKVLTTEDRVFGEPTSLTNSIGQDPERGFKFHSYEDVLKPGDRIVMVTDGISDNVHQDELAKMVAASATPQLAKEGLVRLLAEKEKNDVGIEFGKFKRDDRTGIFLYF